MLVDCVEAGASVSFMLPLEVERAEAFWSSAIESSLRGERILLVAEDEVTGHIVGTVQVLLLAPENQPHRGEVAKMLVHRRVRRRGVAEALMRAAEASALEAGKTLLVLDTSSTPPSVSTTDWAGGESEDTAEEISARTVNRERARFGEAKESSRTSTDDIPSSRRGGLRSLKGPADAPAIISTTRPGSGASTAARR